MFNKCYAKLLAALLPLLLWLALPAAAHTPDISTGRIIAKGGRIYSIDVAMLASDFERMFAKASATEHEEDLSAPGGLEKTLGRFILSRVDLEDADGKKCQGAVDTSGIDPESADGVRVIATWDCGALNGNVFYNAIALLEMGGPRARHHVFIGAGENAIQIVTDRGNARFDLASPQRNPWEVARRYFYAGVEHILTGYDHIAFLLAVVLWATRVWPVVKIVTAFTISHSVTLSMAVLGVATLPSALVEALIAGSIVYVAVENFFSCEVDRRWRDTFFFGFIHGFGFASGLIEIGIPRNAIVPALASFNIGVEVGQIAIVLVVIPLLLVVDRSTGGKRSRKFVYAASSMIAILGAYWLFMRTVFLA